MRLPSRCMRRIPSRRKPIPDPDMAHGEPWILRHMPDLLAVIKQGGGQAAKDGEKMANSGPFDSIRVSATCGSLALGPGTTWASIERATTPRRMGRYYLGRSTWARTPA